MLIGFSGWWTPFPDDEEKAKQYVKSLILLGHKNQTMRPRTPAYLTCWPKAKLRLWWKKRGQPASKNLFIVEAVCTHRFAVHVDMEKKTVERMLDGKGWVPYSKDALRLFCKRDMHCSPREFFKRLKANGYKTDYYIVIRWEIE